jgi:methionyl-tRNA formyltransferase
MTDTSKDEFRRQIAIVARFPFYTNDIRSRLSDLDIQIVSASEITQIQNQIENGESFDVIFFPHYSKIVPNDFLEVNNCVGFHTGDLPNDRGGTPIQNKILRGEYNTRVSAIKLTKELDAGDILCSEPISIENGTIEEILKEISRLIAGLVRIVMTENPIPVPQNKHTQLSTRLNPEASELNIDSLSVKQIYDRIRMLDGLDYPPAYIQFDRYRILLSNAKLQNNHLTFVSQLEEKK